MEDKDEPNYYEAVDIRNGKAGHASTFAQVTPSSTPKPLHSRVRPEDLAYATSDEIGVLIQKMERDRHLINEGIPPDPKFYRHISDYDYVKDNIYETVNNNKDTEEENGKSTEDGNLKLTVNKTDSSDSGMSDTSVTSPKPSDIDTNGQTKPLDIDTNEQTHFLGGGHKNPEAGRNPNQSVTSNSEHGEGSDCVSQSDAATSPVPDGVHENLSQSDTPSTPRSGGFSNCLDHRMSHDPEYDEVFDVVKHKGTEKVTAPRPEAEETITKF